MLNFQSSLILDDYKKFDLSHSYKPDMVVYEGDRSFQIKTQKMNGFCLNEVEFALGSGTHIDSPLHFIHPSNKKSITDIPLTDLICQTEIIDISFHVKESIKIINSILFYR